MGIQVASVPFKGAYRVYSDEGPRGSYKPTTTICYCNIYEDAVRIADNFRCEGGSDVHDLQDARASNDDPEGDSVLDAVVGRDGNAVADVAPPVG